MGQPRSFENCANLFPACLSELFANFAYDESSYSCILRKRSNGKFAPVGSRFSDGYYSVRFRYKKIFCHHLAIVLNLRFPDASEQCVDHIDRDRGNNKISNLRWVTFSENSRNKGSLGKTKSFAHAAYRYVYFSGKKGMYESRWKHPVTGEWVRVGTFATPEEANFQATVSRARLLGGQ